MIGGCLQISKEILLKIFWLSHLEAKLSKGTLQKVKVESELAQNYRAECETTIKGLTQRQARLLKILNGVKEHQDRNGSERGWSSGASRTIDQLTRRVEEVVGVGVRLCRGRGVGRSLKTD